MNLNQGMTKGMKVAISIPNSIFAEAEILAKRMKLSRSKLYARALNAFVDEHANDDLTAIANIIADDVDDDAALVRRAGARTVLQNSKW